jgi:hypothetical protein
MLVVVVGLCGWVVIGQLMWHARLPQGHLGPAGECGVFFLCVTCKGMLCRIIYQAGLDSRVSGVQPFVFLQSLCLTCSLDR